jgi:hypothetical protein
MCVCVRPFFHALVQVVTTNVSFVQAKGIASGKASSGALYLTTSSYTIAKVRGGGYVTTLETVAGGSNIPKRVPDTSKEHTDIHATGKNTSLFEFKDQPLCLTHDDLLRFSVRYIWKPRWHASSFLLS